MIAHPIELRHTESRFVRLVVSAQFGFLLASAQAQVIPASTMNPLLSMSLDEGPSWPVNKVLEPGKSAYCDLTALPKGPILHSYESGSDDGNKLCRRLTMARFNLEWLSDGTERTGEGGR